MPNGRLNVPEPRNEPVLDYAPGSAERAALEARLKQMLGDRVEIPVIAGEREIRTGRTQDVVCPHDHGHALGTCHQAGAAEVEAAVAASQEAWPAWSAMPFEERAAIMGNTVLWKPASTALLSGYYVMKLLEEAGLPPGVINFVPGPGATVGDPVLASRHLAGIHFTGSTPVFQRMWRTIGDQIESYETYPRIVGETGGKDFVFAHPSADSAALTTALIRGAFEYQGQKCSAASRAYVPASLWGEVRERLCDELATVKMGSPVDFSNFMAAVIDQSSFNNISGYLADAEGDSAYEIVSGGGRDDAAGYFVEPTVVRSEDPRSRLMSEEIFGPVLTLYVYADNALDEALELCDTTSPYALTGAVFARDRAAVASVGDRLRHAAGNFYINDKPTGAVVGQQPFGGARASGTNDKAGSMANLLRWTSQRAVKENFAPPVDYRYPHMD